MVGAVMICQPIKSMSHESICIGWLQTAFNSPREKSRLLQESEKLRKIINDIPARQWLCEQARQTDDPRLAIQTKKFIVEMMQRSRLIWGGGGKISPEIYEEALSRTWERFHKDIAQAYNPAKSSFITWFNRKLQWAILDVVGESVRDENNTINLAAHEVDHEWIYPPAPEPDRWHETIKEWLELVQNHPHLLRNCRMQNHPDVNCQFLLIHILQILRESGEFSWDAVAQKYGVEASALKRFCKMRCFCIFKQLLSQ